MRKGLKMIALLNNDLNLHFTNHQALVYEQLHDKNKKNVVTAMALALLLGGFGAHKFYMGEKLIGLLYLVFSWTLIPVIFAVIDLFFIPGQIKWNNCETSLKTMVERSPKIADDVQLLLNHQNSNINKEIVLKIIFGILAGWLVFVAYSGYSQKIERHENLTHPISYYHDLKK